MSSAASISAAKKRRANQVQPPTPQQQQQRPMTAPSLASLTPAQRQQFLMQQQQRMQQMQQPQQQPQQQKLSQPKQGQGQGQGQGQSQGQGQGQGQPNKKPGLTWPAPPIYLMKQMDTLLFQQSQSIDDIKNRLNCIESGSLPGAHSSSSSDGTSSSLSLEQIKPELMSDEEFVSGIVDNIMTNSNLSDIIEQIDAVQNENRELRELLYAQQKTINEMNIMLLNCLARA